MKTKSSKDSGKKSLTRRSFIRNTAALSVFSVIPNQMFADKNNPRINTQNKMKIEVNPGFIEVDTIANVEISVIAGHTLEVGDRIGFALPESWSCMHYCPWVTKVPKIGKDIVFYSGNAEFELTMESLERKDHQRKIIATVSTGKIDKAQQLKIVLPKIRSTWLAEEALCRLWINDEELSFVPILTTIAKEHAFYRVIVPATVNEEENFRIKIVSLDKFWNLSTSECRGTLQIEDGMTIRDEIAFTGYTDIEVKGLGKGVYRFVFNNECSNAVVISDTNERIYFGDLHTHDKTHNCGCGEDAYGYARDVSGLDFAALAPGGLKDKKHWPSHVGKTESFNVPENFTTLVAYEHQRIFSSHHNVIYRDGQESEFEYDQELLSKKCREGKAFLIPHHTGVNWNYHKGHDEVRDDIIPLMEIYSVHGLGEYYSPEHILSYEFNRVRGGHNWASTVNKPAFYRDALERGRRYGLIASCDDHTGQPGKPINGLAAVVASENTRHEIWHRLKQRHTYGTTGERIVLKFYVHGALMGSEIQIDKPQEVFASANVYGTGSIAFVEIVKYGFQSKQWSRVFFQEMKYQAGFGLFNPRNDRDFVKNDIPLDADEPCLFYMRVMQRSQYHNWPAFAWSSPVWVNLE